ncbi:hypothetical protein PDJAM_G00210490, partial [Pangasius djambal]|nr:hypothetical protein [Pangasius djambal]
SLQILKPSTCKGRAGDGRGYASKERAHAKEKTNQIQKEETGSYQTGASRMEDALTALITYHHGDHFWPVMEAGHDPPSPQFTVIGLSLARWIFDGRGMNVSSQWNLASAYMPINIVDSYTNKFSHM